MFNWDTREPFVPEQAQGGWGELNPPVPDSRRGWDERTPVLRNRTMADYPAGELSTEDLPKSGGIIGGLARVFGLMPVLESVKGIPQKPGYLQDVLPDVLGWMDFPAKEATSALGAAGAVKWLGKNYNNMYFIRGMLDPKGELAGLQKIMNNPGKIKVPHDQSVTIGTPAFTPHVGDTGVLYHGDMDKDVKALGLGDIYSRYRDKGEMVGSDYRKAIDHMAYMAEVEERKPIYDILSMMKDQGPAGDTNLTYDSARKLLRDSLRSPAYMRPSKYDDVLDHTADSERLFNDLFNQTTRDTVVPMNFTGEKVDYGPIQGEFSLLKSPRMDKIEDAYTKLHQLMLLPSFADQPAKEYVGSSKPRLLRDPKQVSAEDFFSQQADRFNEYVRTGNVKPSGFYNESVHTLNKDINDRIAGVFTDPNNPNEAILNFARERGLPIFALAKGAEDLPGQTGKEFWADLFKKSGPESGEWVPTRISTGVGKIIRENQDMIMDHFRRMGMLTPDPVSGVTGEGGMKDVIRWIKTYGFADMLSHLSREEKEALRTPGMTYSILPDEVRDALNRSVKQNQKSIGSYFQSSLMPTNRKLHYTGEDFPWE